jgi:hypothetical protein
MAGILHHFQPSLLIYFDGRSAEEIKNQANQEYKAGHYADAIRLYTQAIGKSALLQRTWYLRPLMLNSFVIRFM